MIGFYGGSFNPIHIGHIEVSKFLLKSPYIEKICFTPVYKHPFNKSLAPFEDRVNMIKLAIQRENNLCLSEAEKEKGGVSYTIDLLEFLKDKFGDNFFFLGGLDTLNSIDRWKDWEYIVSNFNILFTTRAEVNLDSEKIEKVKQVSKRNFNIVKKIEDLNPKGLNLIEVPYIPVSSTLIRNRIKNGEDLSGILHSNVISYIYRKKLYKE
ncbi:nicotinate-nucleotide adenylyltransferase [Thermotomaculum hydrothermale]|uniref:Probable nicotinate-nucleotide adenylyltransferase n=1 Tax=Thermotomaculum hydrothermale TaxID=981385 RepID=A0A7R6PMW4_9BACT|nr:nicotinate (nicotinamide) nucleotide adenylyltransferase [Thermotomaculum hydrothermale]BBB32031.1 nicotinate-nucleotide adenylyltransferase [Thermotomaculum hydrothermale]